LWWTETAAFGTFVEHLVDVAVYIAAATADVVVGAAAVVAVGCGADLEGCF
jgi:hypothetical protein